MPNARLEELRIKFQENPRRYFAPFANELRKAGDTAQAISVCRAHLSGQPGHVSGHIVLGQALYEGGEANEARDIFVAALELDPENLIALRTLGEIAQINGEFGSARQWYERLLEADPRNTEVSQLLQDLPSQDGAPSATIEALEDAPEALPFNATEKHEPAPNFHTSFTGSQKAYVPEPEAKSEPEPEPAAAKYEPEPSESKYAPPKFETPKYETPKYEPEPVAEKEPEPAVAQQPESQELLDIDSSTDFDFSEPEATPEPEPVRYRPPSFHDEQDETLDMVDLDAFPESAPLAAQASELDAPSHVDVPDEAAESFDPDAAFASPPAGTEAESAVEAPQAESPETPRARFAEHGFEGPADDQIGWMTTPSASLSEPESAPETWFEEESEQEQEPVVAESQPQEPVAAEMQESDHTTDSWFDEVEGAAVIEATEVTNEEFWLPPDLAAVSPHAESQASEPEPVEEHVSYFEAPAEAEAPAYATQEQHEEPEEPEHFNVEVAAEAVQDAVVVEHPTELEAVPYWSMPEQSASLPDESAPVMQESASEEIEGPAAPEYAAAEAVAEVPEAPAAPFEAPYAESPEEPVAEPAYATPMGLTPGYDPSSPPPPPQPAAPFVTETLAELYLNQGLRDEALAIYRQLAERNPADESLKQRMASIEQVEAQPVAQVDEAPAENRAASQSVRTFFSRLARRPAVTPPAALQDSAKGNPDVPFAAAASALANLFAASKPPASDEASASTLANAYTDPAGRPSRAADRELSLDHLFRDVPPGGQASGGVSLDEFYATPNAQPGSPTEPGGAGESSESGTDIRQFTAWLEGLRKK